MSDNILLCIYFCIIIIFGLSQTANISDIRVFSLGNRKYSTRVMVAGLTSTWVTGEAILNSTVSIFENGLISYFVLLSMPISMFFVSEFLAPRIANFYDCISIGDIMEKSYGRELKIFVGFLSFAKTAMILCSQLSIMGYIFRDLLYMNFSSGVIIGGVVIFICSFFGGAKSVIMTGIVQFGIFIVAVPTICNVSLLHVDGYLNLFQSLPDQLINTKFSNQSLFYFLLNFCTLLVPICGPYTIQKILTTQNSEQAVSSLRYSGLVAFIFYLLIMLTSLSAILLQPNLDPYMVLPYLINELLPSSIKIIAVIGLFSAILSSAQTMLNSSGISVAHDIYQTIKKDKISQKKELNIARGAIFTITFGSIIFTVNCDNIFNILMFANQAWISIIFVPLVLALYKVNIGKKMVCLNILVSIIIMVMWHSFSGRQGYYLNYSLVCLLANSLFTIIYLVFKRLKFNIFFKKMFLSNN